MTQQLLYGRKRHGRAIQSIGSRIKQGFRKRMAQIVRAESGREFCGLAKLRNNLPNAALSQRATLSEKEVPIGPPTPGSNGFSPDGCPLAPLFRQTLTMGEIRIERFACLLDQWDLTMLESFASTNNE